MNGFIWNAQLCPAFLRWRGRSLSDCAALWWPHKTALFFLIILQLRSYDQMVFYGGHLRHCRLHTPTLLNFFCFTFLHFFIECLQSSFKLLKVLLMDWTKGVHLNHHSVSNSGRSDGSTRKPWRQHPSLVACPRGMAPLNVEALFTDGG